MLNIRVRLALLQSVRWRRPPVNRQMSQLSTVPKRISPLPARARSPSCRSKRYLILVPEK